MMLSLIQAGAHIDAVMVHKEVESVTRPMRYAVVLEGLQYWVHLPLFCDDRRG